jgi:hypothetical protein
MRIVVKLAGAGLILALSACSNVKPYEKGDLARRLMQLEPNDLETSYQNKVFFSREVSGGRPGHSAGGGCGCGN